MLKSIIVVTSIFFIHIHFTWNLVFMIVSLIKNFTFMYFNFLDFGLLNELCERGVAEFRFE